MGAEVEILVKPPSKRASQEAVKKLRQLRFQALMLSLPENINDLAQELISGAIEYDDFLEKVEKRLPSPAEAWLKGYEQILMETSKLRRMPEIYCYGDVLSFKAESEKALQLTLLTLRSMITSRVNVEEWLKVLQEGSRLEEVSSRREAEKVANISICYEKTICISDQIPIHIKSRLEHEGIKPKIHYVGQPHHFTPLEVLKRGLSKGKIGRDEVEKLIREHIEFVREYIYREPILEAIDEWSVKKLYWLPRG